MYYNTVTDWLIPDAHTHLHTCRLKGMGGTVGSRVNMWSQRRACMHRARLSTSLAMGPEDDSTE